MVEIYGSRCVRLARLLKRERGDCNRLERRLKGAIEQAIREVAKGWEL